MVSQSAPLPAEPGHQSFDIGVKGLIVRDGRILLLRRRDYPGWDVPGGRINVGEDSATTLVRELHEELPGSTSVRITHIVHAQQTEFILPNSNRLMLLFFQIEATVAAPIRLSPEHDQALWASLDMLPSLSLQKPILEAAQAVLLR